MYWLPKSVKYFRYSENFLKKYNFLVRVKKFIKNENLKMNKKMQNELQIIKVF